MPAYYDIPGKFTCPNSGKTHDVLVTVSEFMEILPDMHTRTERKIEAIKVVDEDFENTARREHEANRSD